MQMSRSTRSRLDCLGTVECFAQAISDKTYSDHVNNEFLITSQARRKHSYTERELAYQKR